MKKETNFYLNNVEKGARMDKLKRKREKEGQQVTLARPSPSVPTDGIPVLSRRVPTRVSLPPAARWRTRRGTSLSVRRRRRSR